MAPIAFGCDMLQWTTLQRALHLSEMKEVIVIITMNYVTATDNIAVFNN